MWWYREISPPTPGQTTSCPYGHRAGVLWQESCSNYRLSAVGGGEIFGPVVFTRPHVAWNCTVQGSAPPSASPSASPSNWFENPTHRTNLTEMQYGNFDIILPPLKAVLSSVPSLTSGNQAWYQLTCAVPYAHAHLMRMYWCLQSDVMTNSGPG